LVAAHVYPLPVGIGFADRAYFQAHKDGASTYVSDIMRGRVVDMEFFQYSRRRQAVDGTFLGVIAISMLPAYFAALYAKIGENRDFVVSMVHEDGRLLVRHPAPKRGTLGSRFSDSSGLMKSIREAPAGGLYRTDSSQFDAVPRLIAYRKVPGL